MAQQKEAEKESLPSSPLTSKISSQEREKWALFLKKVSTTLKDASKKIRLLESLTWGPEVHKEFFTSKCSKLPQPKYAIDKNTLDAFKKELIDLQNHKMGDHPIFHWIKDIITSYLQTIELITHIETPSFFTLSSEIYGNSKTKLFHGQTTNLDLAQVVLSRLGNHSSQSSSLSPSAETECSLSSAEFSSLLMEKVQARSPSMPIRLELTDDIVAKAVGGRSRVRVRKNAAFSPLEVQSLWHHEIESHCLTSQNGALQEFCPFLTSGGARSTRTQEGLAVFYELYGQSMSQKRMATLCHRVCAIHHIKEGADFIETYRWFLEQGEKEEDAYISTQRLFRGAPLTGGSPFTKDVVYLPGLIDIYHWVHIATSRHMPSLLETLVCGRIALKDITALNMLRNMGFISSPRFLPSWIVHWEGLVSFFNFHSILSLIDMSTYQLELESILESALEL